MIKRMVGVGMAVLTGVVALTAGTIDARAAFKNKCLLCHTVRIKIPPAEREKLLGPPVNEVMYHVKEKYPIKEDAVAFMADYILHPTVEKALCASMDKFGLMPSMKSSVSPAEARAIASMLFDRFPRTDFSRSQERSRRGVTFSDLDSDGDGFVSPDEFRKFRAKRNGMDVKSFKADLYFRKVDLNGDGRMSPEEFEAMRQKKMKGR